VRLRVLKVGCFGGGTGLPSLLGGLKNNPWVDLHAVVTMFDSGGSSGQLRDELGVLPPGDVLKCALALARNEGEARRVLLSRLPTLETSAKLAGHTGGNLLLSMMEQYSGDFLAAVAGLEVVPDPPQTALFHVLLRGDRERLSEAALGVAEERLVFVFGDPSSTTSPSWQRHEVMVGEVSLAISPTELAELYSEILARAAL